MVSFVIIKRNFFESLKEKYNYVLLNSDNDIISKSIQFNPNVRYVILKRDSGGYKTLATKKGKKYKNAFKRKVFRTLIKSISVSLDDDKLEEFFVEEALRFPLEYRFFPQDVFSNIGEFGNTKKLRLVSKSARNITNKSYYDQMKFDANKLTVDYLEANGHLIKKLVNYNGEFSLSKVPNLTYFTMGEEFNQPIKLQHLTKLTHFTMGYEFDQLIKLPKSLTHFIMRNRFNKPITLPNSLTYLEMGEEFNKLITLPNSLTYLLQGYNKVLIK